MTKAGGKPDSAGFGRLAEIQGEEEAVAPAAAAAEPKKDVGVKKFTWEEIQKHDKDDDVWIVVNDKVYDCTEYLELHPGGVESISINAGADATEDFVAIHSIKATKMLEKYLIGVLDKASVAADSNATDLTDANGNKLALNPKVKTSFRLQKKVVLSRDSFMLDFALPTPQHILGLPTGKHMFFSAKINGETVVRRYTPISSNYDVG